MAYYHSTMAMSPAHSTEIVVVIVVKRIEVVVVVCAVVAVVAVVDYPAVETYIHQP